MQRLQLEAWTSATVAVADFHIFHYEQPVNSVWEFSTLKIFKGLGLSKDGPLYSGATRCNKEMLNKEPLLEDAWLGCATGLFVYGVRAAPRWAAVGILSNEPDGVRILGTWQLVAETWKKKKKQEESYFTRLLLPILFISLFYKGMYFFFILLLLLSCCGSSTCSEAPGHGCLHASPAAQLCSSSPRNHATAPLWTEQPQQNLSIFYLFLCHPFKEWVERMSKSLKLCKQWHNI